MEQCLQDQRSVPGGLAVARSEAREDPLSNSWGKVTVFLSLLCLLGPRVQWHHHRGLADPFNT